MKDNTFEDYLQEKHSEQYCGLDDDMPDDYADWVGNLDVQELIDFAELWGLIRNRDGYKEAGDLFFKKK